MIAASGGENLGRPHLARVLVDCGHAHQHQGRLRPLLKTRGPLWVDRRRLAIAEALDHPRRGRHCQRGASGRERRSRQELKALAEAGLDAVEAWHPEHPPNQAEAFERWAGELGMLVTAGSDYHGPTVQPAAGSAIASYPRSGSRRWSSEQLNGEKGDTLLNSVTGGTRRSNYGCCPFS